MLIKYGNKDVTDRLLDYKMSVSFADCRMIGNVPSIELTMKFDNYDGILDNIDISKYWEVKENDASDTRYFKVYDQPEKYTKELTLKMYDNNYSLDTAYDTKLSYPVTIKDQLDEIESLTGLSIIREGIPQYVLDKSVSWYDNTIVIRNYLGWIAELFAANVYAEGIDSIRFVPIEKTAFAATQDLTDYEKNEVYTLTRVYAENGLNPLSKGDETGNTLFIDSANLYADEQIIIDSIYDRLKGLTFNQVKNVTMISVDNLLPGALVNYNDNEFTFFVSDLTVSYKGGQFSMSTVDGSVTTKNEEKTVKRVSNTTRIRKLQVKQDQESLKLDIIAKEQEGINDKVAQLSLSNEKISLRVSEVEEKAGEALKQAQGSVKKFICEYASSSIEQTKTSILQTVSENYYSATDGKNLASTVSTIQQTTESIQMGFVKKEDFTSLSDKVSNNQTQLNTYIRFNAEGIEIGKQDSEFKTKQTNSKYSILQNNDEVAYFANNRMYNSNIEVSSSLKIGNFGFIVNSDGSLTFKKVGGD